MACGRVEDPVGQVRSACGNEFESEGWNGARERRGEPLGDLIGGNSGVGGHRSLFCWPVSRSDEIWQRLPDPLRRVVQRARVRAGHFYSPYPNLADLRGREESVFGDHDHFAGIDLAVADQLAMLEALEPLTADLPWGRSGEQVRYSVDNRLYGHGDGVITAAMLRHLTPQRYVEIGSGNSTLLALDVNDAFLDGSMSLTAIDPFPEALYELLGNERPSQLRLLTSPIQSLPTAVVAELGPGDVLFVDSTHVVKAGSDVNHIVFELLPRVGLGRLCALS